MGLRGPKPVDVRRLQFLAQRWADFLFGLRDGQPGMVTKLGPLQIARRAGQETRSARITFVGIVRQNDKKADEEAKKLEGKGWIFFRPTGPLPHIWERLKKASSLQEIRLVAREICPQVATVRGRSLIEEYKSSIEKCTASPGFGSPVFAAVLHSRAIDLLNAKKLRSYPRSGWAGSDDKRVEFFSKVLAGLMLGLAPTTAIKRLTGQQSSKNAPIEAAAKFAELINTRLKGEQK